MIRAVIVSAGDLAGELSGTMLFRSNVTRLAAAGLAEVKQIAESGRPDVVVVDAAMPGAAAVVAGLRSDVLTRSVAIVALTRSDFGLDQLDMLEAGANAILPIPPGADWDDRLLRLVRVPMRRAARLPVDLTIDGGLRDGLRFEARALNLSVNGMLLECRQLLEVGDDLRLDVSLPELGPVRVSGTVVRVAPPSRYGVEITSADGDGRVRVKRYVESGVPD